MITFVEHSDVMIAPDWGKNEYLFKRKELESYYKDWDSVYTHEFIFNCNSSGIPHQHAVSIVIVKKSST